MADDDFNDRFHFDPGEGGGPPPARMDAPSSPAPAALTPAGKDPIRAQSSDGVTHEFAPGTPDEVVDRVMKSYAEEHRDKSTTMGQIGTGMMDPVEGGGQLIANIVPKRVERILNTANNWMADNLPEGLVRKLPEGGKNEQMHQREDAISKERGGSTSTDWGRLAGNVLSPVNYLGTGAMAGAKPIASAMAAGGKAGLAAKLGTAGVGGAVAGAEQPATGSDYWNEKKWQTVIGGGVGTAVGGAGTVLGSGVRKLGEYIARNNPENLESEAVQKILRRIGQDQKSGGPSAADAIDLVNASKKPMALADVGGENVKALAGNVSRQPGEARSIASQFLNKRDEQAAERLSQDIAENLHGGPTMHQATEALLQSRSAAARPAYEAAHDLKGVWSPRLGQFLDDPVMKAGLQHGYELERLQALAEGRTLTATQMGLDVGVDGTVSMTGHPNMRVLDMAKQGLDALIAKERNEITGRLSSRGVALDQMRRAYVSTIDDLDKTGAYKKARETWAGYSQSLDAVKVGRALFQASPEENTAAVAALSPANREFARLGVADMLKERLAKAGLSGDEAKQLIKNPWMRDQLRPFFKDGDDFGKFVDAVTAESKMFQTRFETLGGSATAKRSAEDTASEGGLGAGAQIAGKLVKGQLFSAAKTAYQLYQDIGLKPNPELNAKIAQLLFRADLPAEEQGVQKMLGKASTKLKNPARPAAIATEAGGQQLAPTLATDATKERRPNAPY